ncbi:MAG: cytochrome c3 family protein [Verrucomicrobiota bacterium]|nr:cytochrome c3 family protein [Verrucomicrobiota bacterium]
MKKWKLPQALGMFSIILGMIWTLVSGTSCGTTLRKPVVRPPHIDGASFVGNTACSDCHTDFVDIFPSSPHARYYHEDESLGHTTGCESCHGPGSLHVRAGGGKGVFIHNPGRDPSTCLDCHQEIHAKLQLPSHHPVLENMMNCVECHDPHGRDIMKPSGGLSFARLNQSCVACHQEQARHFVFEHEAMREGCTECHDPHGSVNPKMLIQRDSNLCLKCHAQIQFTGSGDTFIGKEAHGFNMQAGSCWTAGCHTQVHGSMVDPKMRF